MKRTAIIILAGFVFSSVAYAQNLRGLVNDGVEMYNKKKFTDSEVNFKKGLEKEPNNFHSQFNLGDAQYKQQRYDEAIKTFQQAITKTKEKNQIASSLHNIGNSYLKSQKFEESIDAYKKALKLNPGDEETKYNLSYALNKLKQQQNQDKNKDKNKDQNKDNKDQDKKEQNKDDQKNQDKNNKDQQKQNQNQDQQTQQDNTKQNQKEKQQQSKQDKNKMSKQEAQRILNALKNNELDLQKKLRKYEGKRVATEKDW